MFLEGKWWIILLTFLLQTVEKFRIDGKDGFAREELPEDHGLGDLYLAGLHIQLGKTKSSISVNYPQSIPVASSVASIVN